MKIDKYNPAAQHYLSELLKNEKQYATGNPVETVYEEEDDFPLPDTELQEQEEEELDEEETARRKIREIIERGAAAEDISSDQNLEVGSYQEIKYGKHNVLYLTAGLAIGIAAMFFLIMPARLQQINSENLDLKASYSAELSGKNVTINNLQNDNQKLQDNINKLTAQIETMNEENSAGNVNDNVMAGLQS